MMQRVSPLIRGLLALPRAAQAVSAGPGGGLGLRALSDAAEPQTDTRRLYVGNLSYKSTAEDLAEHFGSFGSVQDVVIPLDDLGRSRGFAFVEMADEASAAAALEALNDSDFHGRQLMLRQAHKRSSQQRAARQRDGWGNGGDFGGGGGGWGQQRPRAQRRPLPAADDE